MPQRPARKSLLACELALLVETQPLYKPRDAAALCGVHESTITRHIKGRPQLFPARKWSARHEWDKAEFVAVLWALAGVSAGARRGLKQRLKNRENRENQAACI